MFSKISIFRVHVPNLGATPDFLILKPASRDFGEISAWHVAWFTPKLAQNEVVDQEKSSKTCTNIINGVGRCGAQTSHGDGITVLLYEKQSCSTSHM